MKNERLGSPLLMFVKLFEIIVDKLFNSEVAEDLELSYGSFQEIALKYKGKEARHRRSGFWMLHYDNNPDHNSLLICQLLVEN